MGRAPAAVVVAACAMALGAGACAHATRPVVLERPAGAVVSRLSDLPSMPGAYVVVLLRDGESARGAVETIDGNVLVLRMNEAGFRRVVEEEIVCLARRVGKSTTARGWLGALIGGAASLPFGISMTGDMMMPAAIAGALIAGNTGQPRARVLLDRSQLVAGGRACPGSLTATDSGRGGVSLMNPSQPSRCPDRGVLRTTIGPAAGLEYPGLLERERVGRIARRWRRPPQARSRRAADTARTDVSGGTT
jgi:hypothetical protein